MVLNDEQNERFFDTMDALLYYVNERFHVVEDFSLEAMSPLDDVKSALVARTLWQNVGIIDDFVEDYRNRLPQRCRDLALSWKSALSGVYTLVRYQSGRALLMNDAGVFSVCGVTYELEQEIGPAPAYVEMVLLPFDDVIVYDGFLQAYDTDRSAFELQRIQDEFENRCAKGIALTGADFVRQADAYLAEQREKEFDALLEDAARVSSWTVEELPAGFHRGALAGLDAEQRDRAVSEEALRRVAMQPPPVQEFDKRVRRREPVSTLSDCLMLMTKAELETVAQVFGMGGLSRLRKAQIVEGLVAELPAAPMALEALLVVTSDESYRVARRLAQGEVVGFGLDEVRSHLLEWPLEPYIFAFKGADGYTMVIPDELRPTFAALDFEALDRYRRQQRQALHCMGACVLLCGVVSIDDAYDQYRALVADALGREDFEQLARGVASYEGAGFSLWTYPPADYLVHYTLSPDYVAVEFAQRRSAPAPGLYRDRETGELSAKPLNQIAGAMRADLRAELEELEDYKRDLVASQEQLPMKPLSRTLLENDAIGELLDNPNAVRLRSFLDERIPDGEDDYTFADYAVEQFVYSAIEWGTLQDLFGLAMDLGIAECCEDGERLAVLITNLFNAMPSWENNGWSPQELYEQVTGRKMFYNEDGSLMKVGADDPCPCGSGKKYRDCCGR